MLIKSVSAILKSQGSTELETLGSAKQVSYVWTDLSLTHKLVIQISGKNIGLIL